MGILRVTLFGGLALSWDGVPTGMLTSATARSLLAYLIAHRQRSHTRDFLAGTFWPDLPEVVARRRLSQALWQIHRSLQSLSFLLSQGDGLQVDPQFPLWIDSEEFASACSQPGNSGPEALRRLENCIDLYTGEFMAGYYDDWVLQERERLRNQYLIALEQLSAAYKSLGSYVQALRYARTLVSQEPWREESHREVMRLHHLLGQDAEALKQFEACQRLLEDELGIDPAPETRNLAYEIAGRSGLRVTSWLPVNARPASTPLLEHPEHLPLVGRQAELAELLCMVEGAAHGQGGMALLYGEAGVGKTRLLLELRRNAEWRGLPVVWGRCYELSGPPAYQPLVEILRSNLAALSEQALEGLWRLELGRLLPELSTGQQPVELKPEEEQRRLMEAIVRAFLALSSAGPHLIIIEDAHWMDQASLATLRYLLPRLAETNLAVVISVRSEELSPQHADALVALENSRLPRRVNLSRLSQAETGALVQIALDLEQPPPLFSARLYTETEGNPFFLTETMRTLVDEGLLYRNDTGAWSTPWDEASNDYAEMPLPGSVAQTIQRRLERLPAPVADALGMAAVIGRSISFELWLKACNLTEAELLAAGDELCKRGLLISSERSSLPGVSKDGDYYFAHDQIRHVVYERLAGPRRRLYHKQVARGLTLLEPDKPEALAYHWSAAQVWDKAVDYHQQAGERAMQVYALADALDHFTQALDGLKWLSDAPDLGKQYELRLRCEKIFDLQGARQKQSRELAALAELASVLDDDRRRAEVALRQARQADMRSDFPATIAAARQAVELAHAGQNSAVEIDGHMEWGWAYLMQGEHSAAQAQFEEALALARRAGLRRLEADGLHGLGTVYLVTGEYVKARSFFQEVLMIAEQVDIRPRQASTLANLGYIATAQGNHAASMEYNLQALQIHRQTGDQRGAALAMQNLADEFLAEGNFTAARNYLEQALPIQQATQAQENVGGILGALGWLFHKLGDYERAGQYYSQAAQTFEQLGIRWYQGQNLAFRSLLAHHQGDHQTAWQYSQQGLQIAREIGDRLAEGWLLDCAGHALMGLGELEQAEQAYQQALQLRQEQNEPQKAAESLAGLARVGLLRGNTTGAKEYVETILRIQADQGLAGANEPFRIYLTCYQALEASQDRRAAEILSLAYRKLMAQIDGIEDEALKRSFVVNVGANRELMAAYQSRQGEQIKVSLPRAGAPGGRMLRPDETIEVTWTISTPEDGLIADKAERRQRRLVRLLEQAEEQGAAPTYEHLAQALGAGLRTIKRDMAVLRQQQEGIPNWHRKLAP